MTAGGQISCPPAGNQTTVSGQYSVAAVTPRDVTLLLPDAARPCDLSDSADSRRLGFLLREIVFR